jgi:hypothetical protein
MRQTSNLSLVILTLSLLQITGCTLTHPCSVAPSITGEPSNQTVALGQSAVFTVAASGSAPLSYQWLKDGVPIPGANQASYIAPAAIATESGTTYSVTVTNLLGNSVSSSASLTITPFASSKVRFVAPNGSDSNAGTIDQPYRSIQYCATTVAEGWTCEVRGGTYRETITPNSGITISSHNLEPVTIDGSDPITGWVPYRDGIYKASVTLGPDDSNQVFVGSEMMTEARWPNGNSLFHVIWGREREGTDARHIVDSRLPHLDWIGAKVHLWSGSDPFGHETGRVTASEAGRLGVDMDETGTCPAICPVPGGFYYLFGTLSALDVEREWYYDSESMALYFMAPGKVNPNTIDVRAKRREYAFDLRGKTGVRIRNIAIFASTIVTDSSSSNNTLDRINAQYVSHFTSLPTISGDPNGDYSILLVHLKDSGIVINGTGNTLENSEIAYSAGAGIALEGNNNTIRNNLIHHVDYIGDYASGIDLDGNGNTIQYNTIHSVGRQAIYVSGVLDEDIAYNNIHDSMMLSRDGAAIYACCSQSASGTRIHHNWIHDTQSLIDGAGDTYSLAGIGIDNGSSGLNVDQNVFWRNRRYSLLINGVSNNGPNTTYVHNNTIPDRSANNRITIISVPDCTSTRIEDNRMVVKVEVGSNNTPCAISDNRSSALGATEMLPTTDVGCNFAGCSSDRPSAVFDDGFVTPCPVIDVEQTTAR